MKKLFAILVITGGIAFVPIAATAQERLPEAGMGAAAGALVAGPVGLVAGGIIGYTAGPNIRRGLGIPRHSYYHHRYRYQEGRRY